MGIVDRPIQRVYIPLVTLVTRHQANFLGDNLVTGKKTLDFAEQ